MSNQPPKRTTSGNHPAVVGFRKKLESIHDGTLADLEGFSRKLDEEIKSRKDPRRDGDSDPPVDVVEEVKP